MVWHYIRTLAMRCSCVIALYQRTLDLCKSLSYINYLARMFRNKLAGTQLLFPPA